MNAGGIRDQAPDEERLTDYDRHHVSVYLRLLDAEAAGASWEDAARVVLGIDAEVEPERAKTVHESHISRARWLRDHGYQTILGNRTDS